VTTSVVAVPAEFVSLTEKVCVATLVGVPANTPPEESFKLAGSEPLRRGRSVSAVHWP
jgi:hypothetical protein